MAISSVLAKAAIAPVDPAGLRRFNGTSNLVDIGALEFGDMTLLNGVANALPSALSEIISPGTNGAASR